jgi:hypothetical protein
MKSCHLEMNGTGDHHIKLSKPGSERQISHAFSHMWNLGGKYLRIEEVLLEKSNGTGEEGAKRECV